jgi:adenine-specific DNA-methyltransferase
VFEPSCGEADVLFSMGVTLRSFGSTARLESRDQLVGVEFHEVSATAALLGTANLDAAITVDDVFSIDPAPIFDAVVGDPPYRYQDPAGEARRDPHRHA